MKKIKEIQKRSTLSEGRNFGIGFSILNKINSKFETYLPFTACRDYLNDFVYVEKTKKEIGETHGYDHKVLNCFENKKYFYLGVNTLHYQNSSNWDKKEEATNLLINNYKNLESFLNQVEDNFKFKSRTTIKVDEDTLIFKIPIYWSKSAPLISVYTLLIRCFFNISENFVINEDNLKKHKPFISSDNYFIKTCINFLNNIKAFDFEKVEYKNKNKYAIHNFGIQGFLEKK